MDVVDVQMEAPSLPPPSLFERRLVNGLVRLAFNPGRAGKPRPVPDRLPHRAVAIESAQGVTLAGTWFTAEKPRGAVVLAHPDRRYARHWFVREGWIDLLVGNGYECLAFDFPGYGETRGPPTYHHEHVEHAARFARWWAGGLPVHLVGLSLGAFALANASPRLDFVESLVLESPYASFNAWYGRGPGLWTMRAFDAAFPRSRQLIQADQNLARAHAKRILVALAEDDEVTAPALTEAVHRAAPAGRAELVRVPGARHLEPFAKSEEYRARILKTLG